MATCMEELVSMNAQVDKKRDEAKQKDQAFADALVPVANMLAKLTQPELPTLYDTKKAEAKAELAKTVKAVEDLL